MAGQRKFRLVYFYDTDEFAAENRVFARSGRTVTDYICDVLVRLGYGVEIVSAAETRNSSGAYPARRNTIAPGVELVAGPTHGHANRIMRALGKTHSRLWLVRYLMRHVKRGEVVMFWHSGVLFEPLLIFKMLRRKNVKLLCFCGELFKYVLDFSSFKSWEEDKLLSLCDAYVFSTEMLDGRVNESGKPHTVLHGTYHMEPKLADRKFDDGRTHIVYSGIINETKGAFASVEISKQLGDSYCMHICGCGSQDMLDLLNQRIEEANDLRRCEVRYEGELSGDDYKRFLQSCHIGICPQSLDAEYNDFAFPSKLLSYLSNGLQVVSADIPAIRTSRIAEHFLFCPDDDPEKYAEMISKLDDEQPCEDRYEHIFKELDSTFEMEITSVIDSLYP